MENFTALLSDRNIEFISCVQRFAYRCINMFSPYGIDKIKSERKRKELMDLWHQKLFKDNNIFLYSKITYDETLWSPDVEHGSIVKLEVKLIGCMEIYVFFIDLNKDYNNCIIDNVNIFNVEFIKEN